MFIYNCGVVTSMKHIFIMLIEIIYRCVRTLKPTCVCSVLVGKTSLITRFMYDSFDNTYQVRSGTDPEPKNNLNY